MYEIRNALMLVAAAQRENYFRNRLIDVRAATLLSWNISHAAIVALHMHALIQMTSCSLAISGRERVSELKPPQDRLRLYILLTCFLKSRQLRNVLSRSTTTLCRVNLTPNNLVTNTGQSLWLHRGHHLRLVKVPDVKHVPVNLRLALVAINRLVTASPVCKTTKRREINRFRRF